MSRRGHPLCDWLQTIATGSGLKDPARKVGVTGLPAPPATRSAAVSAMISHRCSTTSRRNPAPSSLGGDAGHPFSTPVQRQGSKIAWRLVVASCQRRPCATAIPRRSTLSLTETASGALAAGSGCGGWVGVGGRRGREVELTNSMVRNTPDAPASCCTLSVCK